MPNNHTPYNMADYAALLRSGVSAALAETSELRFDGEEDASLYFARELDHVKAKTYDKIYPEMTALKFFPSTSEVDPGAESVTYYSYEKTGMAKIISNYATDLPRVDVKGSPHTAYVKGAGASYGYSIQEMRAAKMTGKGLEARKAESARYAIDYLINKIAWAGLKAHNIIGVLSKENDIPVYILPAGAKGSTRWKDKTAKEILADVNAIQTFVSKITKNVERPDTLLLPHECFMEIANRQLDDTSTTVLKFIQENAPYLKTIESASELQEDAADTNPYGMNVAFMYQKNPDKFAIETPIPFMQHPAQPKVLEIEIPCEARTAGAIIYYPLSALIIRCCPREGCKLHPPTINKISDYAYAIVPMRGIGCIEHFRALKGYSSLMYSIIALF